VRPIEISPGVHWTGTLDSQLRVFDIIMRADHGTTYNAFLVQGEKTAVIDTTKSKFAAGYFDNLRSLVDLKKIYYIVLNHMEPDHSGSHRRAFCEEFAEPGCPADEDG
jgi:flavorubredoxin